MPSSKQKQSLGEDAKPSNKRIRLNPAVRRQQILEAALIEFSALGFSAASISKIASRAGTSKANLYVHFANKDQIFETLLRDVLQPSHAGWQLPAPGESFEDGLDAFIDGSYNGMSPQTVAIMKLLISEGHRVPEVIRRWQEETMQPAHAAQQRVVDEYVKEGVIEKSPLTDNFGFVMVPLLYAVICQMIFTPEMADAECKKTRETHRQLLHMFLKAKA